MLNGFPAIWHTAGRRQRLSNTSLGDMYSHSPPQRLPFSFHFHQGSHHQANSGQQFYNPPWLLVDPARMQMVDNNLTPLTAQASTNTSPFMTALSAAPLAVLELLAAHLLVFAAPESRLPPFIHGTTHTIETEGHPVFAKARRLLPKRSLTRWRQPALSSAPTASGRR